MEWYYANQGRKVGPVSEAEIASLASQGIVAPSTLVWRAGMADWQSWSSLSSSGAFTSPNPAWTAPAAATTTSAGLHRFVYAGFWIRALAYLIDGAIIGAIRSILLVPFGMGMFDRPFASPWFFAHLGEAKLAGLAIALGYFVFFWTQYGATPGKMILKLKVVTPQGNLISAGQAVGRYFGQILSGLIFCIGFMMAGWDEEKRALHDRLADTRVIRVDR